jgi:acetyl esterase
MPVDPQIQALLDKGTGVPATHTLPVDVARAQYEARISLMARPADIAGIREQAINGPREPLRLRIYTPHGTGPFPLLVFFHGSGFVLCSLMPMMGCAEICVPAPAASLLRSITDWRLSTNFRPDPTIACTRRDGRLRMLSSSAPTQRASQ